MEYTEEDREDLPITLPTLEGNRTFLPSNMTPYITPEQPAKPTMGQSLAAAFRAASPIVAAYRDFNLNPLAIDVDEEFNPANWEMFEDIDPKRFPALFKARSHTEQQAIREILLAQQHDDEIMLNSGWFVNFTGSMAGGLLWPSTLIPIAAVARNTSLAAGTLNAISKGTAGVVGGAVSYEASQHVLRQGVTLEETVMNTFADITMGTLMVGAGYGLGHGFHAGRMWEARKMPIFTEKGIEVKPIVERDGTVVGYDVSSPDRSASAAEVDMAKRYIDSKAVQSGLFAVPLLGGWLGKGMAKLNSQWRMQTSPYSTTAAFSEMLGESAIITKGIQEGRARTETFESKMIGLSGENKRFFHVMQGLHSKRNGIDASNQYESAMKNMISRQTEEGYVSPQDFGREIHEVFITGEPSPHAAVNEAVSLIRTARDPMYDRWRQASGLPEEFLSSATMHEYATRDYDQSYLQANSQGWNSMWVKWLNEADGIIESYHVPIRNAEAHIAELEAAYTQRGSRMTDDEVGVATREIEQAKRDLTSMRNALQDEIRANPELRILVEDFNALSASEAAELATLLQPSRQMQVEIDKVKALVSDIQAKVSRAKQSRLKARTQETRAKHQQIEDELTAQINAHRDRLTDMERQLSDLETALQDAVRDGKVNPMLYNRVPGDSRVKFKDTSNRLKLREVYRDDNARIEAAENFRNDILGNTAEDIMQQTMFTLSGGRMENPNPTMKRSLLIPDRYLFEAGFLSSDIARTVINYRNMLGRSTFMKEGLKGLGVDGFEGLATALAKEHRARDRAVNAIEDPKKRAKAARKIRREYDKNIKDLKMSYDRAMGRSAMTREARTFFSLATNTAVSTRLGATPLTMVTEPFAIVLKHQFWPTIRDGVLPTLLNMKNRIKGTGADSPERLGAADLNIALEHVTMGAADRNWNGVAIDHDQPGLLGSVATGMERVAQHSGNWSMMNYIDNWLQRVTANVVDSKLMRYANKFVKGELTPKEAQELRLMGINPERDLPRFVDGWKSTGSDSNGLGGYHSHHTKWTDLEAANLYSRVIRNTVRDTIVRRGLLDVPFLADNPLAQMYFTFKGWSFAALGRYTLPLMQRPDAQMLTGVMMMLSAGAFVTPLRRLVRGEDPITDDDSMFWNALVDGGTFSLIAGFIEDANVLSSGQLLKGFQNDKYRNLGIMGIMGGVPGGIANDMFNVVTMAGTNNWNERDMKKMARLIPFTQAWYLRKLSNTMLESLQLPSTMAEAERMKAQ